MALTLNGTSGIVGAGIGTIGPSGANVTGVVTCTSVVSSGAISGTTGTFTGDVSISDKIVHTGDVDTSLRFPGTDTIALQTIGTTRIHVASDGKIGINTSEPTHNLDVHGTGNQYIKILRSGSNPVYLGNANGEGVIETTGATFIKTGGSESLRVDSSGNTNITGICTATEFAPSYAQLSNRNLIHNGDFKIWQRAGGTSYTGQGASGVYTADRWHFYPQNTSSRYSISKSTEAPTGFNQSLRIECTTADTSIASNEEVQLQHSIEAQDLARINSGTSDALEVTVSFWAKSTKTGIYIVRALDRDNSRDCSKSYTISDTDWHRYSLTFPADTSGGKFSNDTGEGLRFVWWLVAGSTVQGGTLNEAWRTSQDGSCATGQINFADSTSNNFYLTGVQCEVGKVATPFEHRSYGDELLKCQRYYYHATLVGTTGNVTNKAIAVGVYETDSIAQTTIRFPVVMRANPTLISGSATNAFYIRRNGSADMFNSFTLYSASPYAADIYNSSEISGTQGQGGLIRQENTDGQIGFSAEMI